MLMKMMKLFRIGYESIPIKDTNMNKSRSQSQIIKQINNRKKLYIFISFISLIFVIFFLFSIF